jgi:hypothetical protein
MEEPREAPKRIPEKEPERSPERKAPKRSIQRVFRMAYAATVTLHDPTGKSLCTMRYVRQAQLRRMRATSVFRSCTAYRPLRGTTGASNSGRSRKG